MHELAEQAGIELPRVLGKVDRNGMNDSYANSDDMIEANTAKHVHTESPKVTDRG